MDGYDLYAELRDRDDRVVRTVDRANASQVIDAVLRWLEDPPEDTFSITVTGFSDE